MGYGDYLMLSGKLKYLDNEFNKKVQICFPEIENRKMFFEIFKNNPRYTLTKDLDEKKPYIFLNQYFVRDPESEKWIEDQSAIPGEIYFDKQEIKEFNNLNTNKPYVIIQPFFSKGKFINGDFKEYQHYVNRNIPIDLVNEIVNIFKNKIDFYFLNHEQFGYQEELKQLSNIKMINVMSFRESMYYLSKSIGYFGIEGGLHHVAGALKKNAIVIFGHWISPILTGYPFHNNISSSSTKYGCGTFTPCIRCIEFLNNLSSSYIQTIFEEKFLKE